MNTIIVTLILLALFGLTLINVLRNHVNEHDRAQAMIAHATVMRRLHDAMRVNPPRMNMRGYHVSNATMLDYAKAVHAQRAAGNTEYTYTTFQ